MCGVEIKDLKNALVSFFCTWGLQLLCGITVRNPMTLVFFAAFFYIGRKVQNGKRKGKEVATIVSLILAVTVSFTFGKNAVAGFDSSLFRLLGTGIMLIGLFFSYFRILQLIFGIGVAFGNETETKNYSAAYHDDRIVFVISAIICFLFWMPYFLYEFPGIMTADSIVQYEQIIGVNSWSNHHPVVHTLVIGFFYRLGLGITGDANKAISFYTLAQMIFLAMCCGRVVICVKGILGNLRGALPALLFFALVPFNAVFAVTIWKDVPFAGIMMLMGCRLITMAKKDRVSGVDVAVLAAEAVMVSLFRSNGWYGFLISVPFIIYVFRKDVVKIIAALLASIIIVIIIKGPVMNGAGVTQPDFTESLSLPLQQIARVLVNDRTLSREEKELVDKVIDTTYIHELYAPDFADNIKELVRAGHPEVIEENKAVYLGLWIRLGLRYPADYIRAWFDLEGGYVYSDIPYEVGNIDGIMPNGYGLVQTPLIGGKAVVKGKEILIKLGSFVPLYGMLWCAGAYTWLVVYLLILILRKNKEEKIKKYLPFAILQAAVIFTLLIAAPMVDFRYEYGIVMLMPLTVAICVIINKAEKENLKLD